jgi:hypothetical protein
VSRAVATTSARLAKIAMLAPRCARPGRLRCRSPSRTCPGSCRNGRSGSAGPRCGAGSPRRPPPRWVGRGGRGFRRSGRSPGRVRRPRARRWSASCSAGPPRTSSEFLYGLLSGELRQGALEGVMTEAVARAASVPVAEVRRAMMLRGSLGRGGRRGAGGRQRRAGAFGLEVGRPVRPMLAASASSISDALSRVGGARRRRWSGSSTASGSRPIWPKAPCGCSPGPWMRSPGGCPRWWRLGPAAGAHGGLRRRADRAAADGRPLPFQDTAARAASQTRRRGCRCRCSCSTCCTWTGADLIDLPDWKRHAELAWAVPSSCSCRVW